MSSVALRIEWCKARARAHRWQEECILLAEEMRRTLAFWEWEGKQWTERGLRYPDCADPESRGRAAYAAKQLDIRRRLAASAMERWEGLADKLTYMDGQDASELVKSCHV
jgi:hypothetical protein